MVASLILSMAAASSSVQGQALAPAQGNPLQLASMDLAQLKKFISEEGLRVNVNTGGPKTENFGSYQGRHLEGDRGEDNIYWEWQGDRGEDDDKVRKDGSVQQQLGEAQRC